MEKTRAISEKDARIIMGRNFFGTEEAISKFRIDCPEECLDAFAGVPFAKKTLEENRNTHVLAAVFPVSIVEIREKVGAGLFSARNGYWYGNEDFATEKGVPGWRLVRMKPVCSSFSKNWDTQCLISNGEKAPSARIMVYTVIGYYLVTDERLFEKVFVRTNSTAFDDYHVVIGCFGPSGLCIDIENSYSISPDVGISAALNLETASI